MTTQTDLHTDSERAAELSPNEPSLGERFKQARKALNLSLDDVSKQLNLRPIILQQIENDEFAQKNIPPAFMKGYVRSYARFLRLPDELWKNRTFGEMQKNDLGKNARSTKAVNRYSSHNWVGCFSALVLLLVVGMTAWWWWENYQQSNVERDNLVQTYVANQSADSATENTAQSESLVAPLPSAESAVENSGVLANTTDAVAVSADNSAVNLPVMLPTETASPQAAATENTAMAASQSSENQTTENPAVLAVGTQMVENQAAESQAVESPVVEEPQIAVSPSPLQHDLVIEVTAATSWISVKDANRKKLAEKEYKQGETLTFNGNDYYVIIGAPANVKITYKGENYPLKVDGRIAKFRLPKP